MQQNLTISFGVGLHQVNASESSILGVKELWKSRAPNKCCFFIWLSLLGRTWTSERLFRHGIRSDDVCALCSQEPETIDHLL
jgi:hypothetical protein